MSAVEPVIRPYRPTDRDAINDVCLRTAAAGKDASALYRDHDLVGDVFAAPYGYLEPDLSWVVDNGERAVGYVVGTADSVRFARRMRELWLPIVGDRHPAPAGPPANQEEGMALLLHTPEDNLRPELADYPAHLHINLLPGYQGGGLGRRLINIMLAGLHAAGAPRVHLGMANANVGARAFYDRVGFTVLPVANAENLTYLGRSTSR